VRALRQVGLEPWGIVLSRGSRRSDPSRASNLAWVKRQSGVRRAVVLPRTRAAAASELLYSALSLAELVG
jgi:hypothetical protein